MVTWQAEATVVLSVVIGGLGGTEARAVVSELERAAGAAAERATKRLLLGRLHDSRVLDERLLAGGYFEVRRTCIAPSFSPFIGDRPC